MSAVPQRREPRICLALPGHICAEHSTEPFGVIVFNLSTRGAAVAAMDGDAPATKRLTVVFKPDGMDEPLRLPCQVAWHRLVRGQRHIWGLRFDALSRDQSRQVAEVVASYSDPPEVPPQPEPTWRRWIAPVQHLVGMRGALFWACIVGLCAAVVGWGSPDGTPREAVVLPHIHVENGTDAGGADVVHVRLPTTAPVGDYMATWGPDGDLIVDVPGQASRFGRAHYAVEHPMLTQLRVQHGPERTRFVLQPTDEVSRVFDVRKTPEGLWVDLYIEGHASEVAP